VDRRIVVEGLARRADIQAPRGRRRQTRMLPHALAERRWCTPFHERRSGVRISLPQSRTHPTDCAGDASGPLV